MKLRGKITLVILVIVSLYAVLDFAIQRFIIFPSFVQLEAEEARENVLRSQEAIQNEIDHLKLFSTDWSMWDDTYRFVQDSNEEYIQGNLQVNTFQTSKINLLYFYNKSGQLVWGKYYNLQESEFQAFEELPQQADNTDRLFNHTHLKSELTGVMTTTHGPLLFVSVPIITSNQEGPIQGTLISGRLLNQALQQKLVRQTHVTFNLIPAASPTPESMAIITALGQEEQNIHLNSQEDLLHGYTLVKDYLGKPAFLIHASTPKEISKRGESTLIAAVGSVVTVGIMVVLVLLAVLKKMVVRPLLDVTRHALAVGKGPDYSLRLGMNRTDEIGILANEIDATVERLADYQKRLADQSYQAGMAEHAAATLHNLRNALVSLTVPIENLHEKVGRLPMRELAMALDEWDTPQQDPQRRTQLEQFIKLASRSWLEVAQNHHSTFNQILDRIHLIDTILGQQEHLSRHQVPLEYFTLDEVIDEAQRLEAHALGQIQLEKEGEWSTLGLFHLPRVVLLQVVSNLLANSAESIQQAGLPQGQIHIHAQLLTASNQLEVTFRDNGAGMTPEILDQVFQRRFSTKSSSKTRGLGLHWCSNAVIAMGGQLTASSNGAGQGATFRLVLPRAMEIAPDDRL